MCNSCEDIQEMETQKVNSLSEVTVRCLIAILDPYSVLHFRIEHTETNDIVYVSRGILTFDYILPKGESEYIRRAWNGEMGTVVSEILDLPWRYESYIRPKSIYTLVFGSYLFYQTPYHLQIISRLARDGINDWDETREHNIIYASGHPEVILFV